MPEDFTSTQIEMLDRRWREDPSPHLSLQLADLYRQGGKLREALPVLEKGLERHPESVSLRVALGRYQMELGDPESAAESLRSVVDADPGHLVANKLLIRAHLAVGEVQRATDRLDLYALLNDSDPEIESLRSAVEGRAKASPQVAASESLTSSPAIERAGPVAVGTATPGGAKDGGLLGGDLRTVPPPVRRTLSGRFDSGPFEVGVRAASPSLLELLGLSSAAAPATGAESMVRESPGIESSGIESPGAVDVQFSPEPPPSEPRPEPEATVEPIFDEPASEIEEASEPEGESDGPTSVDAGAAATSTLGMLYLDQGHLDDAEETFRRVLERDPEDAEAQAGLAEIEARRSGPIETRTDSPDDDADGDPRVVALRRYLGRIRAAAKSG